MKIKMESCETVTRKSSLYVQINKIVPANRFEIATMLLGSSSERENVAARIKIVAGSGSVEMLSRELKFLAVNRFF